MLNEVATRTDELTSSETIYPTVTTDTYAFIRYVGSQYQFTRHINDKIVCCLGIYGRELATAR